MAKALGNAAGIEGIDRIGGQVDVHGGLPVVDGGATMWHPRRLEIDANHL
jgi:hypothetical protein